MLVHCRAHNGHDVRVWTNEMAEYGQFNVVKLDDFTSFVLLLHKLNLGTVKIHRCDGIGDCNCHVATYGEDFKDSL